MAKIKARLKKHEPVCHRWAATFNEAMDIAGTIKELVRSRELEINILTTTFDAFANARSLQDEPDLLDMQDTIATRLHYLRGRQNGY